MRTLIAGLLLATLLPLTAEPWIVAHRGASADAPENTMPAFLLAWKQGADAIEGDFQLTRDGHIVCIHDKDTKRVAKTKLTVAKSTLAELRKLQVGSASGTGIPTLTEVLACVPKGKRVFIEVKCGPEILPALQRDIRRSKLSSDQVTVIAFDSEVIRQFKAANPESPAYWLTSFKKNGPLKPGTKDILATLRRIRADGVSTKADARIDSRFTKTIRDAGFSHHVWTVDDAETARRFATFGAASITTNRPQAIRSAL